MADRDRDGTAELITVRKLATAAAVSLALASGGAFGLGLGDIEMRSSLNQPMNAEIPLTAAQGEELDGMIVKLADADAFARAGIERGSALTDLRFDVENVGGRPVIRVTSSRPVVEPFLNFLLEVDWPQGRMVREYTVLLDPPVFGSRSGIADAGAERPVRVDPDSALIAPAPIERTVIEDEFEVELVGGAREVGDEEVADAEQALTDGELVSLDRFRGDSVSFGSEIVPLSDAGAPNLRADAERGASDAAVATPFEVELVGEDVEISDGAEPSVAGVSAGGGDSQREVRVQRGDTLYRIASENLAEQASVEQMMLALLDANRSAFINENINLVKAGSILRVPRGAEVRALSQAQALAEIGRQSDLWREYRDNLRGTISDTVIASRGDADAPRGEDAERTSTLSSEAQDILDSARAQVRERDELRIVADTPSASIGANATVDQPDDNRSARLGEINRRLQLAREELTSSRLEGRELDGRADELQSTSENLDALVNLRQNEIARLESQLASARADDAAGGTSAATGVIASTAASAENALAEAGNAASDIAGDAGEAIGSGVDAVSEAGAERVGDAVASMSEGVGAVGADIASAGDAVSDDVLAMAGGAAAGISGTASSLGEQSENALSAAGQTLEQVDLLGDENAAVTFNGVPVENDAGEAAAGGAVADGGLATTASSPWYESLLKDPVRLGIAGAGTLGLLGLGALLLRRRGAKDKEDEFDEFGNFHDQDIDVIDEDEAAELQAELDGRPLARATATDLDTKDTMAGVATAGAAGIAAGAAATAAAVSSRSDDEETDEEAFAPFADRLDDVGSADNAVDDARGALDKAEPDKDDTISEVDVYLAYGLHGQAEELLLKASERQPDNQVYAAKLLETYHAQGNGEDFERAAEDYHMRFGGEADAGWSDIAAMGRELRPESALFLASGGGLAAAAVGGLAASRSGAADAGDDLTAFGTGDDQSLDFGGVDLGTDESDVSGLPAASESLSGDVAESTFGGAARHGMEVGEPDVLLDADDETALMDQSLDPAFAFDERDLEATGDFSRIAEELAAEDDGSLDFTGFDETVDGDDASSPATDRDALDDALTLDELDGDGVARATSDAAAGDLDLGELSSELSLDLDRLGAADGDASGLELGESVSDSTVALGDADMLDEADMIDLDATLDEVDALDLTTGNELLDGTTAPTDGSDDMETMMDLAKAYIDMGDKDSASNALDEIVKGGNPEQVSEAETLLRKIS